MKTPLLTQEIRESFLGFFERNGHTRVASSGLVPNDPTLLFTAAGMVQFKDCFLGVDKRAYTRAASSQKCLRAGGKHNDLENVGFTSRHHTFFEMLGNFSFGDYFKEEAIKYAWEFSTKDMGLDPAKMRVSVHVSDDEAAKIWQKVSGFTESSGKIVRFDADNFWAAGDTGPCGPCSELFYDQGQDVDGERFLEYWNCVFMQYQRGEDGKLVALPKPSVDTGMGLERMASILQGRQAGMWYSNYDIDLMGGLIEAAADLVGRKGGKKIKVAKGRMKPDEETAALRVIVDHLRATSFLVADGVLPSNEGRGYVLRRILRRAVRFGTILGLKEPVLTPLVPFLQESMGKDYPELLARGSVIKEVLQQEETKFLETLDRGLELIEKEMKFARTRTVAGMDKIIPGDVVFKLHDTFGFPSDLTALIAQEKGFTIDEAGFKTQMEEAQERSRASWKGSGDTASLNEVKEWKNKGILPKWTAYESAKSTSKVLAVAPAAQGQWVAIDPCPFYGESGGQVGDRGELRFHGKAFKVLDCQKPYEGGFALYVDAPAGALKAGDTVEAVVDETKRSATRANHTATHLLHAALRKTLGTHVQQAGSLVNEDKLRFDFSHGKAISDQEMEKIEAYVNEAILRDQALEIGQFSYDDATKKKGALAFFGDKYGDVVRVVDIPGLSTELCGGLHVKSTGEIRFCKVIADSAVAAGTRRMEALTGSGVLKYYRDQEASLQRIAERLKTPTTQLEERVDKLLENQKKLEQEIEALRKKLAQGSSGAETVSAAYKGNPVKIHVLSDADPKMLRDAGDALRQKEPGSYHVILAGNAVLVTVDETQLKGAHAGDLLKGLAQDLGGRGGGQARTAQGQLNEADASKIAGWMQSRV